MRLRRLIVTVLIVVVSLITAPLALSQQHNRSASQLDCIKNLVVPRYAAVARMARLSGTAHVILEVTPEGLPARLQVKGVPELLDRQVREAVTRSRFVPNCAGRRIELQFVFTMTEEISHLSRTTVVFSPPGRFEITVTTPVMNPQREPKK